MGKCVLVRDQSYRVAVKPQELSLGETCRRRVPCAQEYCYEETRCVPGKDGIISFTLPVVTIKLLGRIIDLLFDLLEVNSQCARPHSKEIINMIITYNLFIVNLQYVFPSTQQHYN